MILKFKQAGLKENMTMIFHHITQDAIGHAHMRIRWCFTLQKLCLGIKHFSKHISATTL